MDFTTGIIYGLITMFFWGIAKLFIKPAIDRIGPLHALFYERVVIIISLLIFSWPWINYAVPSNSVLIKLLIAPVIGAAAIYSLFKAMEKGKVSIVTPIAHSATIVTIVLSYLFYKESLTGLQLLAVALLIMGVILISFRHSQVSKISLKKALPGTHYAVFTLFAWGMYFFMIKPVVIELGPLLAAVYLEAGISALIAAFVLFRGFRKPGKSIYYAIGSGISVAIAALAFNIGIEKSAVSLVYPVANSALLVTVIGSYIFLKERIEQNQKIAIGLIVIGIILISV